jgi:hypothetical protein
MSDASRGDAKLDPAHRFAGAIVSASDDRWSAHLSV